MAANIVSKESIIREMGVEKLEIYIEKLQSKYDAFKLTPEEEKLLIYAKKQLKQLQ